MFIEMLIDFQSDSFYLGFVFVYNFNWIFKNGMKKDIKIFYIFLLKCIIILKYEFFILDIILFDLLN